MEMTRKEVLNIILSSSAEGSVYCNNYSGNLDFDFLDRDENGVRHEIELKLPLELARTLLLDLTDSLAAYDKRQAEKEAEKKAEAEAEAEAAVLEAANEES
jgi:hypothetical protein